MDQHITQLAAFVDGAGRRNADVARHATRRRELAEQSPHTLEVLTDLRVDFRVGSFQIDVGDDRRTAVSGTGEVDGTGVGFFDQPVQVHIDEAQTRRRPPVAQQSRLDVFGSQRLAQQRILPQIDLAHGQVIGCTPIPVDVLQTARIEACQLVLLGAHPRAGDAQEWGRPMQFGTRRP